MFGKGSTTGSLIEQRYRLREKTRKCQDFLTNPRVALIGDAQECDMLQWPPWRSQTMMQYCGTRHTAYLAMFDHIARAIIEGMEWHIVKHAVRHHHKPPCAEGDLQWVSAANHKA